MTAVAVPANAADVARGLRELPGSRDLRVSPPLIGGAVVAGIEVVAVEAGPERTLRRIWRDRQGGGATPLLLICDDTSRPGCVLALFGGVDAGAPLRSVSAEALAPVFDRLAPLSRLDAVRELTAELDRLDQAGIPGLKVRELLTLHTLDVRLRNDALRWSELQEAMGGVGVGADWRAVLGGLGYQLERRRHRGWLARWQGRPTLVVHPKADPAEFARLDGEGRPPEGVLLNDCRADGAGFGLLTSGSRLRLFDADPSVGSAAARYLDLDAGALQEDDRQFLGLVSPAYLAEGKFAELEAEARAFGAALRQRLDERIRQTVLPTLGRALGRWAKNASRDLADDSVRGELERAALTLIFRALFVLYAEGARYLPMEHRSYQQASLNALVDEASENLTTLDPRSTSLWDRFVLLVKAMRTGNTSWGVPAYNGALFAPDGFEGAEVLEQLELTDPDFGQVLVGLGREPDGGQGVDYSTLEIGHLGHIYESLLSLSLSVADADLRYDVRADQYMPAEDGQSADVERGDLLWQTHEGGRKGGGVYYTRAELVRHLVREAVAPAFTNHLAGVRETAVTDPAAASEELFDFAVLDPACGSAHFLVVVVNELADMVVRFLADVPLPRVAEMLDRLRTGAMAGAPMDDVALLRRLVLKRCVFGVDLSLMGAEVAKLSLWLASFVPGLSLAYLDRNVQVGNSLVGVARPEGLLQSKDGQASWLADALDQALARAADAATRIAESEDRTPGEIRASQDADAEAHQATAGLELLFDAWTAQPFGVARAREEVELHGAEIISGRTSDILDKARSAAHEHRFLHWPLAFPRVFTRPRPGFDAVIGNPPWEEVTVERLGFFGLFRPRLRSMSEGAREEAIAALLTERPELGERLEAGQRRAALERQYLSSGEYPSMTGDPDLYKFFCQRYRALLRDGGALGVVLPRSTFVTDGSAGFREWLFERNACERLDFLLNSGRWAFDSEPRYTIGLVSAKSETPAPDHRVVVAGTASSLAQWDEQTRSSGIELAPEAFGPGWTVPLLRSQAEADLLAKVRHGSRFPFGSGGRWRCFPVAELHETNDRRLWEGAADGRPLWKGESFDQYDPHGAEARLCPESEAVLKKVRKPRPGAGSLLGDEVPVAERRGAVLRELASARVAFRDVSRATDSRTVRACLIPPRTFLLNSAPYLSFLNGGDLERAACLGVMNSLPFDWQARRFVENHLNFFILEGLVVPDLQDDDLKHIAQSAARLSCVDERFGDFAEAFGVETGSLPEEAREDLRLDIDARVARAWELSSEDLEVLLADFATDAVPAPYREKLHERLASLG